MLNLVRIYRINPILSTFIRLYRGSRAHPVQELPLYTPDLIKTLYFR